MSQFERKSTIIAFVLEKFDETNDTLSILDDINTDNARRGVELVNEAMVALTEVLRACYDPQYISDLDAYIEWTDSNPEPPQGSDVGELARRDLPGNRWVVAFDAYDKAKVRAGKYLTGLKDELLNAYADSIVEQAMQGNVGPLVKAMALKTSREDRNA